MESTFQLLGFPVNYCNALFLDNNDVGGGESQKKSYPQRVILGMAEPQQGFNFLAW